MPELPEVETIRQSLLNRILNHKIIKVNRITNLKLKQHIPINIELIERAIILSVERRSKYLIIKLDNKVNLIIHLGMSGKLLIKDHDYFPQKHDHFSIKLDNNLNLIYNDPRRFGLIDICDEAQMNEYSLFKNLGVEPFSSNFTTDYLINKFKNKKQPIKLTIMDNNILVGVGNIYASESLFLSKIPPLKPANQLLHHEVDLLRKNIITVLNNAIMHGGSSLKDYSNINGEKGYFQNNFYVYGRIGQNCKICCSEIKKLVLGGRSTFYCHNCQNN